jgi:hypothetical protein
MNKNEIKLSTTSGHRCSVTFEVLVIDEYTRRVALSMTATHVRDLVAHPVTAVVRVASVQENLNVAFSQAVEGWHLGRASPLVLSPKVTGCGRSCRRTMVAGQVRFSRRCRPGALGQHAGRRRPRWGGRPASLVASLPLHPDSAHRPSVCLGTHSSVLLVLLALSYPVVDVDDNSVHGNLSHSEIKRGVSFVFIGDVISLRYSAWKPSYKTFAEHPQTRASNPRQRRGVARVANSRAMLVEVTRVEEFESRVTARNGIKMDDHRASIAPG